MSTFLESIFFPWDGKSDDDELHDGDRASSGGYSYDDGQSLETFDHAGMDNNDCDMFSSYENEYDKYGEHESDEERMKRERKEREQKILNGYYDKGGGYHQQSPIEWFVNSLGRSAEYDLGDEQYRKNKRDSHAAVSAALRATDEAKRKKDEDKNAKGGFRIRRLRSPLSSSRPTSTPKQQKPVKQTRFRLPFTRKVNRATKQNDIDPTDSETDTNSNTKNITTKSKSKSKNKNDNDVVVTVVTKDTNTTGQESDYSSMFMWANSGKDTSPEVSDEEQQVQPQQQQEQQYQHQQQPHQHRTNATAISMTGELSTVAAVEDVAGSNKAKDDDFAIMAHKWSNGYQPTQLDQQPIPPAITTAAIPVTASEYPQQHHPQMMLPPSNNHNNSILPHHQAKEKTRKATITVIFLLSFMLIMLTFLVIFMMLYIFKVISIRGIEDDDGN